MTTVLFDDSLGRLVSVAAEVFGEAVVRNSVGVRDATGRLGFVAARLAPLEAEREQIAKHFREQLDAYARPERVVLFQDDPGAERLLRDAERQLITINGHSCWLVDRRIVGSGWLARPAAPATGTPRVVFASLKGGVGRSTALAVAATDLAARGRNILVIDLDLEAPGLGELLLTDERLPRLGVLDYLVENNIGGVSDSDLDAYVGVSPLTLGEGGRVDVLPAFGSSSQESPQNVLPKLARAMIEKVREDGTVASVGNQMSGMIDRFAARQTYDIILVDSRAGLAELAAPAVLGLGAAVLLFGTAQRQTIAGYRALFAGFKLLANTAVNSGETAEWRQLFKPVYAKATLDAQVTKRYAAELYELFADNLYDDADEFQSTPSNDGSVMSSLTSPLNFAAEDPEAPHTPLIIPFERSFAEFDPARQQNQLTKPFYEQVFRQFLNGLDRVIDNLEQAPRDEKQ